jgi:hypothetical protein
LPPKKIVPTLNGTTEFKPEKRTMIDQLLFELGETAGKWRETHDRKYVKQYEDIYKRLRAKGWEGPVDFDTRLPDQHMPEEYRQRFLTPAKSSTGK